MYPKRDRVARSSGAPRQRTSPRSGSSTPSTTRIAVVFPAPFGPTKPNICPASTEKESPARAMVSP